MPGLEVELVESEKAEDEEADGKPDEVEFRARRRVRRLAADDAEALVAIALQSRLVANQKFLQ